ncbi:hypothetical protein [Chryseobacterium sp. MP_3.2]|uniref:hypothetical protein n=1 Tax=Chryseobacterium sp. MP_3.2 TaxID=3071712 RepID=UPI002E09268C|nr:gas vesicle protein [Chryseobacterium sp. MP_3.2]
MQKNYFKIFSIVLAILFLILLTGNFGLNYWLKNNLPNYIKNNSDYLISYKEMDVHLGTGNITATGISINNKNSQNDKILGLQGTVDSLDISKLGMYDVLFNKKFSTSRLILKNPKLHIVLPKPLADKKGKKKHNLEMDRLKIDGGSISIFTHAKRKFFSVEELNIDLENIQIAEESSDSKLPLVFERHQINGKNFFYRPDNVYAFTAKYITTKEGLMNLRDFQMVPLLSYQNFRKFFPKKRNLFDVKSAEMEFQDFEFKGEQITLTKVRLESPVLKIYTTSVSPSKKEKSFTYDVNLEDVIANNARVEILKPNGNQLFGANNISMSINKLVMNEETAKGNIPFQYTNFGIKGKDIRYSTETQNINVALLNMDPKSADFQNISIKPTAIFANKSSLDLTAKHIALKINEWKFVNNKLSLNIQNVLLDVLKGKISTAKNQQKKQPAFEGINFPLKIRNVQVKNSDLTFDSKNQPLIFTGFNATIQNIEMNAQTVKSEIPFKSGDYTLTTKNFLYKTRFYNLSSSFVKLNKNTIQLSNFALKPNVSRAQYIGMIPTEKDLYDITVRQITANGNWDLVSKSKFLTASSVVLNDMDANIFRSKIPADDLTKKPMYSELLRSIKFPLFIQDLMIKNSLLVYEEDTKKSDGPGKLVFEDFNLNAKNINSGKTSGKPTKIPITIKCKMMGSSPMNVNWTIDTASRNDSFTIAGNVGPLAASNINAFTEPYLKIRATGIISDLIFNFKGNKTGLNGSLNMKHQNLKVSILKETGEKSGLLSAIANMVVKTNSGKYPESVPVENVERDATKSFFNLLWKGIEQGLKKTLIGANAPKTEQSIRNTVGATKSALEENKKDLQETKKEVQEKAQETKEKVKEKGLFKNLFKKKSEN